MNKLTIRLPEVIINMHCHGRDMEEAYKTTVTQVLSEALQAFVSILGFEPNTSPAITTIEVLERYLGLIHEARQELRIKHRQYVLFGLTDDNLPECEIALGYDEVPGIKDYPLGVTTGSIGVSKISTRIEAMRAVRKVNKVYKRHCDNPPIIARSGKNGINPIEAEVADVEETIALAKEVPGVKIVIAHVSCVQSALAILMAQRQGMNVIMELGPHYLWFDADCTNWNPNFDPVAYKCFNNLRPKEHRLFLTGLLPDPRNKIIIASDHAPHTWEEKLARKLGGMPSIKETTALICTLAKKIGIPDERVCQLLSWTAGETYNISTSRKTKLYRLEERIDNLTYNNGKIINPWNGSKLLFPIPMEE